MIDDRPIINRCCGPGRRIRIIILLLYYCQETVRSLLFRDHSPLTNDQSPHVSYVVVAASLQLLVTGGDYVYMDIFTATYISGVDHPPAVSFMVGDQ